MAKKVWNGVVSLLPGQWRIPFSETLRRAFGITSLGQIHCRGLFWHRFDYFYSTLLKVPFGSLFGLTVGILALLPFGGTVGVAIVTLLVALRDIKIAIPMLIASVITQQLVENGIAPRVLG